MLCAYIAQTSLWPVVFTESHCRAVWNESESTVTKFTQLTHSSHFLALNASVPAKTTQVELFIWEILYLKGKRVLCSRVRQQSAVSSHGAITSSPARYELCPLFPWINDRRMSHQSADGIWRRVKFSFVTHTLKVTTPDCLGLEFQYDPSPTRPTSKKSNHQFNLF